MKSIKKNSLVKKIFISIFTILILFSVDSYAKKAFFLTSTVVPAARGFANITRDRNRNYVIKIQISGLAEVKRLQPSKHTYIVWMVTDQDKTKNIGQLKSSSGVFSKKLKASLETRSSFKPVKIFITAEDEADIQYPGMQMVLSTSKFWN
jgi:hypothetical protein